MFTGLKLFEIPLWVLVFSLVFFSRGILIFLTIFCLVLAQGPVLAIQIVATNLRWVFLSLFAFHVFGDGFLGRAVRKIKIFDVSAFLFISYAFLSIFYSPYPALTLERATTVLLLYFSVFWVIWKYAYDKGPEKVVYLLLRATMLIFIISYLVMFISPSAVFMQTRFQGIFQSPNSIGITCAIILPLSLWQNFEAKKSKLLSFLILLGLFLSGSRNSIIAVVVSMGYFIHAYSKKNKPLVFLSSLTFILVLYLVIGTLSKHFFQIYSRTESIPSLGGRIDLWPYAWQLIMDKPFFGYGFGVEEKLFQLKYLAFINRNYYAHNSYLGMLLQLGIFGFIIFYAPIFILLFKELFSRRDSGTSLFRYALRASLIAGLVSCVFESWVYSVGNAQSFSFWIIIMLLVFCHYRDKEEMVPEGN